MVKGIDLSRHNGKVDFSKVAKDGISFVILRAGYGRTYKDTAFDYNVEQAVKNGLQIGIYWFMYANSAENAIKNAEKCYESIKQWRDKITLKVWADWEYDSDKNAGYLTNHQRTEFVVLFLNKMKSYGFDVGVYANPDYIRNKFEWSRLSVYPLWIAKYSNILGDWNPLIWQYSSKGTVSGITGNVDLNNGYWDSVVMPTLKKGDKGENVKILQTKLNSKGYNLIVDGDFGTKTRNAVIDFQSVHGLVKDGIVGKNTWSMLMV